jgi:hydroxyethylthiazole kinase
MSSESALDAARFCAPLTELRARNPLVHCLTNYVTVNDCANALLAIGASPVMADDAAEVAEITAIASAVLINIGTLNRRTVRSMRLGARRAREMGKPTVLDPVGAGASRLRTGVARRLVHDFPFTVIRGNASEIGTLCGLAGGTRGVDVAPGAVAVLGVDLLPGAEASAASAGSGSAACDLARTLARATGSVVVVTGAVDYVSDGRSAYSVANGHPLMPRVTGTGCMLSALTAAFCGAVPDDPLAAATCAVACMGLAGERAAARIGASPAGRRDSIGVGVGTSSFRSALIDELSRMDESVLAGGMRVSLVD